MFNFKVMNRALNDSNLSDKAFRMLYTIINYCSLKNSNSVEVHNAHLMMVLNISERWVRKITNELVEKGYITKKVNGTSQNKLANTYTLIDVEVNDTPTDSLCNDINKDAKNCTLTDRGNNKGNKSDAQKFPLKNNNKINKKYNIHVNIHDNINTGNNIPEFIQCIKNCDFESAFKFIEQKSNFPAICSRICAQEKQCESKCTRGLNGEPVSIGMLETGEMGALIVQNPFAMGYLSIKKAGFYPRPFGLP